MSLTFQHLNFSDRLDQHFANRFAGSTTESRVSFKMSKNIMSDGVSKFSSAKLSKALRGARRAGHQVNRVTIYNDDTIELEVDPPRMTEADLLAGLKALDPAEQD